LGGLKKKFEFSRGVGGGGIHHVGQLWKFQRGEGVIIWKITSVGRGGGGMDIFWNYTVSII